MNRSEHRARAYEAASFIAILDSDGNLIARDRDPQEAFQKAAHYSPTGTVVIDGSVEAKQELVPNAPITEERAVAKAVRASGIDVGALADFDWGEFDPEDDKKLVEQARARMRGRGAEIYNELTRGAAELVHYKQARGGVARKFSPGWLLAKFLRQNQKMLKVLDLDIKYDSIGLSLLPHGASFREPFDTSTDQGAGGKTFCAYSTTECRMACLVNTGQRALESGAFASGYLFSQLLREMPVEFCINIFDRCMAAFEEAYFAKHGRFIRLNVLSDLPWEAIAPGLLESISMLARARYMRGSPGDWSEADGYSFYDYTKIPYRRGIDGHYDLTFSFGGQRNLYDAFFDVLDGDPASAKRGAVVFVKRELDAKKAYRAAPGKPLMTGEQWMDFTFMGKQVWNGDLSDIRPLDPDQVKVVGLAYKVARYKVAAGKNDFTKKGVRKKFNLLNIVESDDLDRRMPTFLVRVVQPDPESPPIVAATQDLDNRLLEMFDFSDENT